MQMQQKQNNFRLPHVSCFLAVEVHLQPAAGGAGGVRPAVRGGHRPHPHLPRLQLQQLVLCGDIQQVSCQKSPIQTEKEIQDLLGRNTLEKHTSQGTYLTFKKRL